MFTRKKIIEDTILTLTSDAQLPKTSWHPFVKFFDPGFHNEKLFIEIMSTGLARFLRKPVL